MLQLEQKTQHDLNVAVARRWRSNMVDSINMEHILPFEGNEISKSNQRLLLETYFGNKKTQKSTKLSSWTSLKLYLSSHH
jgi:hypothetical protein